MRRQIAANDVLKAILESLDDSKAEDIVSIDIAGKSALADFMVIASGRSQRHVGAIADHLTRDLTEAGGRIASVEGMPHCDWVLIDAGDVIVHVFRPEVRSFYNLEKMWSPDAAKPAIRAVPEPSKA
jgi:ribosome-associated protein